MCGEKSSEVSDWSIRSIGTGLVLMEADQRKLV